MNVDISAQSNIPGSPEEFLEMYRNQLEGRWVTAPGRLRDEDSSSLMERFKVADPAARLDILIELSRREDEKIYDFFKKILSEADRNQEQLLAMIGLGQVASPATIDLIVDELKENNDPTFLSVGINLLESLDVSSAKDLLIEFLVHSADEIKFHASRALSNMEQIDDDWLVESLKTVLAKEEEPSDSLKYFIILLIKERPLPEAADILVDFLEDEAVRVFAIEVFGELQTASAYELVEPFLDSEEPMEVFYAAEALGKIGNDSCWEKLENLSLNSEDQHVRYYSTVALTKIDAHRSVEVLLEKLRDEEPAIRGFAAHTLVELGDVVLEPYRKALGAEKREAVRNALYVLGEIGNIKVIPDLLDKAYSVDKEIEHYAIQALHKVAARHDDARRLLFDRLPEAEPELQINIIRVLNGLGDSELCCYLSRYLKADDAKLRFYIAGVCSDQPCPDCLHLLRRLCRDDNLSVATFAVNTLTLMDNSIAHKMASELAREEIRPLVLVAYLRGFYISRVSVYQDVVEEILQNTVDRRVQYFAGAALKAINRDRFRQLSAQDEYLQKIFNKVQVD
ncbi:MAG: HEAT repeat domain-containing protein [bacterium]